MAWCAGDAAGAATPCHVQPRRPGAAGRAPGGHGLARGALLLDHPVQPARAAQRVGRARRTGRAEVVRALPAVLAAELGLARAVRPGAGAAGQQVVQRVGAQGARGLQLLARSAHRVVQAQGLAGALGQGTAVHPCPAGRKAVKVPVVTA